MDFNRRQVLWAGGAMGAAALLAACSSGSGDIATDKAAVGDGKPKSGGTLRIGALGRAGAITRDPHGTQANESDYLVIALVFDTLAMPGAKTNTVPRLAASWEPSADLKTWKFKIAKGAAFHDGTPVTAEDVVWSLRRLRGTPQAPPACRGSRARRASPPRAPTPSSSPWTTPTRTSRS